MTGPSNLRRGPRRSGPHLAGALVLLALLAPAAPARGQVQQEAVQLSLRLQTAVATAEHPLQIAVDATNTGPAPIGDLTLALWVYNPVESRTEYAEMIAEQDTFDDPVSVLAVTQHPVDAETVLEPGARVELPAIVAPLLDLADSAENALYPVMVQLESGNEPVAQLRSALVHIVEKPLLPLNVSLTFVLTEQVRFRPDGLFVEDGLERSLAPGGRLDAPVFRLFNGSGSSNLEGKHFP